MPNLPQGRLMQAAAVAIGLSLGVAGVLVFTGDRSQGRTIVPSVKELGLPAAERAPLPPPDAPVAFTEPATPEAAVDQFLGAEASGRSELSFQLLREKERRSFGVLASWVQGRADRPVPESFRITGSEPAAGQSSDVRVEVRRRPSLDPFAGFVAAVSKEVWTATREDGKWRVRSEPTTVEPLLPDDAGASAAAERWVAASRSCDRAAVRAEQSGPALLGSRQLASLPCDEKGAWRAGQVDAFEAVSDSTDARSLASTFGPEIETWARVVRIDGPGRDFYAALVPLGDDWRVFALVADGGGG